MNPYIVKPIVFESGERFHVLQDRATGLPLFEPMMFVVSVPRTKGLASATVKQVLSSIMVLQLALDQMNVDIEARLLEGRMLDLNEVESVIGFCRREVASIVGTRAAEQPVSAPKVVKLEKVRMGSSPKLNEHLVDSHTVGVRVRYIRDYLDWLAKKRELSIGPNHPQYVGLSATREVIKEAFTERVPKEFAKDANDQRQGLSADVLARLREVIKVDSPDNPWKGEGTRARNKLIIEWLLALGLRNGELLGIKISNINFQANEVTVKRQADDSSDPRTRQPNTKTRSRTIPMSEELVVATQNYIAKVRREQGVARKTDTLFVANGTGKPLSLSAVNKLFAKLREKCPGLPIDLTPHVLRHSWNDSFSDLMDEKKVPEEQEKRMRNELMGWSPNSKASNTYTRRITREKAKEASRSLQKSLMTPAAQD